MKMGTTHSPFPYDAVARHALQSVKPRHPATLHYASRAQLRGGPVTPSIVDLSINLEIDVMCQGTEADLRFAKAVPGECASLYRVPIHRGR
jgi:hypothetical protein